MPERIPPGPDGGRPEIALTPDEVTQVEALAAVLNAEQIADYFRIGRTTFYEIMKRQPEVAEFGAEMLETAEALVAKVEEMRL